MSKYVSFRAVFIRSSKKAWRHPHQHDASKECMLQWARNGSIKSSHTASQLKAVLKSKKKEHALRKKIQDKVGTNLKWWDRRYLLNILPTTEADTYFS